jgi:hypothetical protein
MSNIIAFPIGDTFQPFRPDEIEVTLPQERIESARDRIQGVLTMLMFIYDDLEKRMKPSIDLETANSNVSAKPGWI